MRVPVITLTFTLLAAALLAQQPSVQTRPAPLMLKTFATSADVAALIAEAKSARKDNQAIVTQPILQFAPYTATLEYRASVGPAALHEKDAEMMYVIDGSATLMTGGKLVGETRTNAANLSGTAIQGGESKKISKGDFIVVPEGTPHWFSSIDGTLVLMTIKMPRGATP
jgi:mannose-6-phosphate isomerase-like protein (cupin superfamily)